MRPLYSTRRCTSRGRGAGVEPMAVRPSVRLRCASAARVGLDRRQHHVVLRRRRAVLLRPRGRALGHAAARAAVLRAEPHAALARLLQQPARRLPGGRFQWRRIWGAYFAAVGFNNVVPARGGDVIKLFLTRSLDPRLELSDGRRGLLRGVDLRCHRRHLRADLRLQPGRLSQAARLLQARRLRNLLSRRALPPDALSDHRAGVARAGRLRGAVGAREGVLGARAPGRDDPQRPPALPARSRLAAGARLAVPLRRLLVPARRLRRRRLGARTCCSCSASTRWPAPCLSRPGGAGVQQALLVKVFAENAPTAVVAAYSVGQQIAIAAFTATVGLGAVVFIFRFRSFKEVITAGRASRDAERAGSARRPRTRTRPHRRAVRRTPRPHGPACPRATAAPRAPRARA